MDPVLVVLVTLGYHNIDKQRGQIPPRNGAIDTSYDTMMRTRHHLLQFRQSRRTEMKIPFTTRCFKHFKETHLSLEQLLSGVFFVLSHPPAATFTRTGKECQWRQGWKVEQEEKKEEREGRSSLCLSRNSSRCSHIGRVARVSRDMNDGGTDTYKEASFSVLLSLSSYLRSNPSLIVLSIDPFLSFSFFYRDNR